MKKEITSAQLNQEQSFRIKAAIIFAGLLLANVIFFSIMWAYALVSMGQPITQTFSWILARNTSVQIIYSAWYVFYLGVNFLIFVILIERTLVSPYAHHFTESSEYTKEHRKYFYAQHVYEGFIWCYVVLNSLKLAGLLLLFIFPDEGETMTLHYVWAGIAFGGAMGGCLLIFLVRVYDRTCGPDAKPIKDSAEKWRAFILFINFLSLVGQVVMGVMFVATPIDNAGVYEFVLALLIMLDLFYILVDYVYDAMDVEIIFKHVNRR